MSVHVSIERLKPSVDDGVNAYIYLATSRRILALAFNKLGVTETLPSTETSIWSKYFHLFTSYFIMQAVFPLKGVHRTASFIIRSSSGATSRRVKG